MEKRQRKKVLSYIEFRIAEQIEDNIKDSLCIATKRFPNHLGVDYHMIRKEAAKYIKSGITKQDNKYFLLGEHAKFFRDILKAGVARSTIERWLRKYEGFQKMLYVSHRPN